MDYMAFKDYLAKKYEVEGNEKFGYCFRLAWDYGQGSLQEVEKHFIALVGLIK